MSTEQIPVDNELFLGRLDATSVSLRREARFEVVTGNHEEIEGDQSHEKL